MTVLNTLKLTNAKKPQHANVLVIRRHKLSKKIGEQIALLKAKQSGTEYTTVKYKSYTDKDSGIRKSVAIERRVKAWWFTADNNKLSLQIRYGNKVIELQKGKPTIELNSFSDLETTLQLIQTAVENGELDKEINQAAQQLRDNFVNT